MTQHCLPTIRSDVVTNAGYGAAQCVPNSTSVAPAQPDPPANQTCAAIRAPFPLQTTAKTADFQPRATVQTNPCGHLASIGRIQSP